MEQYPFDLLDHADASNGAELLGRRNGQQRDLQQDAPRFRPGVLLKTAIHTALAVGEPLLLTGEAGTGKTQAAYYVAHQLGLGKVLHFQVKSGSTAQDLLYHFDHVGYFREANLSKGTNTPPPNKMDFITKGELWWALESDKPRVLLIDEIDKAPRDFPNDLLHELDQMKFKVPELKLGDKEFVVGENNPVRPLVFITSNSERRLPEAFLRRCTFHHIAFDAALLEEVKDAHRKDFEILGDDLLNMAMRRFLRLREHHHLRKVPATGEFLVWLRVMALAAGTDATTLQLLLAQLDDDDRELPYLGVLLKDRHDLETVAENRFDE
ncbi:MAG: MoxR family ATPase [Gammaproteobacteria bacterium]|nr:MoxR family ATPase [Gammaproteobacteria bacterium]MBU1724744.1 MoxR family ATPase [Gammaproteobacteria bacterium]MBU2005915.1 MoxR family ATPase [Gammaproteobacteria bacterium]